MMQFGFQKRCIGVYSVDLGESFHMSIYLQNLTSIQPRTSLLKFARSPCTDPPGKTGMAEPDKSREQGKRMTELFGMFREGKHAALVRLAFFAAKSLQRVSQSLKKSNKGTCADIL